MFILRRVVFFLLLACAACNLNQTGSALTPTAPPPIATEAASTTPTAETAFTTYNNATYGYMFEYPAHLRLDGDGSSQLLWIDQRINVVVADRNPETPMGDAPVIESAQDVMMGVNNGRLLKGYIGAVGGNTPQRYQAYVIQNDGRYYQFIAYELKQGEVQPVDRTLGAVPAATLALLEQIVTSLRFTT